MVGAVPARRALERLRATDLKRFPPELCHQPRQLRAADFVVDRAAVPVQLGGGHAVVPDSGGQPVRSEPYIATTVEARVDLGLVRRLVRGEPHIAVGARDPPGTGL